MEGVSLTTQHSDRPVLIQGGCAVALAALQDGSMDRSAYGHIIAEVKGLLENRVFNEVKISREQNRVTHCLANYGRSGDC